MSEEDMKMFEPQGSPNRIRRNGTLFDIHTVKRLGDGKQVNLIYWADAAMPIDGPILKGPMVVEMPINTNVVITEIVSGRIGDARMFAKQCDTRELPALWVERWKEKRCMHGGVPNKNAMKLLIGLRKRIPPGYLVTRDGTGYLDKKVGGLVTAGLVVDDKIFVRGVSGYRTSLLGYEVLSHWANTRKDFAPFFKTFCPDKWERDYKANLVIETLQGKNEQTRNPFYTAAGIGQALTPGLQALYNKVSSP